MSMHISTGINTVMTENTITNILNPLTRVPTSYFHVNNLNGPWLIKYKIIREMPKIRFHVIADIQLRKRQLKQV